MPQFVGKSGVSARQVEPIVEFDPKCSLFLTCLGVNAKKVIFYAIKCRKMKESLLNR